ncbi:MAG: PAS domain-containing sensor histidine kinase [Gammaproteobacteria bacterium]|nr:PAS domain-containing sensor histidine kinase [Gammaproteobacteria bacterium]
MSAHQSIETSATDSAQPQPPMSSAALAIEPPREAISAKPRRTFRQWLGMDRPAPRRILKPRELFDCAPCGLLVTDGAGVILEVNRTLCQWVGREPKSIVGLTRLQEWLELRASSEAVLRHADPNLSRALLDVKFDLRCDGRPSFPVIVHAVLRPDPSGVFYQVSLTAAEERNEYERLLLQEHRRVELLVERQRAMRQSMEDAIAEAAQANQQAEERRLLLEQARSLAEDRRVTMEQIHSLVAKELGDPVSALVGGVSVFRRGKQSPMMTSVLNSMAMAAERIRHIAYHLHDYTAIGGGAGLELQREMLNAHELTATVVQALRANMGGVRIEHIASGNGQHSVDANRIAQVVAVLVANAATHGEQGGLITVKSNGLADEGFELSVHNMGKPLPADALSSIFEPTYCDAGAPHKPRTTMRGLYLVREIARGHGGRVSVTSTLAEGTTFTVVVPAPQS